MEVAFHLLYWKGIQTLSLTVLLFDRSESNGTSKPSTLHCHQVKRFSVSQKPLWCISHTPKGRSGAAPLETQHKRIFSQEYFAHFSTDYSFTNQSFQGTQSGFVLGSSVTQWWLIVPGEVGWRKKQEHLSGAWNATFLLYRWVYSLLVCKDGSWKELLNRRYERDIWKSHKEGETQAKSMEKKNKPPVIWRDHYVFWKTNVKRYHPKLDEASCVLQTL